ncbi:Stk1 family PASTA domain-containing Ser/Thr kinase [Aeromicrobium sp. YIM 150415]|uniref:Stk1 family PASTA domain-containing Ser/Thr kinase n=1 Tax=Aeromicrobium sp. YIM 150415 TaxID=2803912 RepID=UPI0019649426|nr:Stk1 family PASTA domain-containing Ser/Thr kinase [Aeromicrobium sp. YIM 150415]MBM9463805.1 Stk1 family PASTA domain-containing Ser/Thr kinase [Aeromicrobium sp. YIM 150415]
MTESDETPVPLGDRYEISGLLGRGGMADVREGRDLRLGRPVAIKQLRADLAADPTFQERFRREAQSAASLNHPSIVAVYDTGEAEDIHGNNIPYIVMELVEGRTLRDVLRDGRKIMPERALSITADILSALDYSHRAGIIHRDIKPANIMLTPAGQVKVMDFGIARAIADSSSAMTQTAAVIGTAQYLSPEQARGETVDARSDIYSTGCVLYELLTGRPPFVGDSPVSVAYQHVREEATPPSQLNPEVSLEIDHIVAKALAKRVDDRYSSAADMRKDIERVLAGGHVDAPTQATQAIGATAVAPAAAAAVPTAADADEEGSPSKKKWWIALAVLLIALIAALGFGYFAGWFESEDDPVAQTAVPAVAGMDEQTATRALDNEGLQVGDVVEEANPDVESGQVIRTEPGEGETVDEGSAVDLVISTGPEQVEVPNLRDYDADSAEKLLADAGFQVERQENDNEAAAGTVLNTNPPAGTSLPKGSTVTLIISRGQVAVPNVVGQDRDDAQKTLEDAGFTVNITEDANADEPNGRVISQNPGSGTQVSPGAEITITVSTNDDDDESPSPSPPRSPSPR